MWHPGADDAQVVGFAIRESGRCCSMTHGGMRSPWHATLAGDELEAMIGQPITVTMRRLHLEPGATLPQAGRLPDDVARRGRWRDRQRTPERAGWQGVVDGVRDRLLVLRPRRPAPYVGPPERSKAPSKAAPDDRAAPQAHRHRHDRNGRQAPGDGRGTVMSVEHQATEPGLSQRIDDLQVRVEYLELVLLGEADVAVATDVGPAVEVDTGAGRRARAEELSAALQAEATADFTPTWVAASRGAQRSRRSTFVPSRSASRVVPSPSSAARRSSWAPSSSSAWPSAGAGSGRTPGAARHGRRLDRTPPRDDPPRSR